MTLVCVRCGEEWEPYTHFCDILIGDTMIRRIDDKEPEPLIVWVVTVRKAYGEENDVEGVYDTRERAFDAVKAMPNMTAYVDTRGILRGRPVNKWRIPTYWATGKPFEVETRANPQIPNQEPSE